MSAPAEHNYAQYQQHLYINTSPGAVEPIGFVADNATLKQGQTTWGFFGAANFLLWSPTGKIMDVGPPTGDGSTKVIPEQGFVWQSVDGAADVFQLYWNQTQHDEVRKGVIPTTSPSLMSHSDLDPVLTPAEM